MVDKADLVSLVKAVRKRGKEVKERTLKEATDALCAIKQETSSNANSLEDYIQKHEAHVKGME